MIRRGAASAAVPFVLLWAASLLGDPAADKSQFTFLDPTPDTLLRDMDTDRPNVTNTPHTIDAGHLQLETGIFDTSHFNASGSDGGTSSDETVLGGFNLRAGLLNDLEVNAALEPAEFQSIHAPAGQPSSRLSGFGDATVGAKWNLWGNDGPDGSWDTALAMQPQIKFPTARRGLGNGHVEAECSAPFLMNLPSGFHLGLQIGAACQRNTANTAAVAGLPAAVSVDRDAIGNLDAYVEYASQATTERHQAVAQTLDLGGTYPLGKNVVVDSGVAIGLNRSSAAIEATAGISIRR